MADSSSKPVHNGQSEQNVGGSAPQPQNQTGLMAVPPPHQNWNQQTQNWNQQTPNWNQQQWNVPSFNNWNHPPPPFPQPPPQFSQQFGPPQNFGPPQQHRQTNNIWGDPNLYQPYFSGYQSGPPPGGPPRGGFGHHQNRGGFNRGGGRGRGGGNGGRNQGQNGGGSQPNSSGNQHGGGGPNFQNSGGNFNNGRGGQNNQGNNGNQGKNKKKERVDKRDLPENNVFHCEVCDRGFPTDAKYKEHVDQHEKCPIKECAYVAASRLVEIHYNVQHRTGVAKKIWNIKSSEEIKQWIEERKKNFPTKEKVEKKRKEFAERKQRGETIQSKNFGKMKDSRGEPGSFQRGRGRGGRGGRGGGQGHGGHRGRSDNDQSAFGENGGSRDAQSKRGRDTDNDRTARKRPAEENSTASSPKKSKQNSGQKSQESVDPLSLLIQGNSDSPGNSDDDDVSGKRGTAVLPNPEVRCGGLANLIASYDSDDDSEEEGKTKGERKKDEEEAVEETTEEVSSKDSHSFKRPLTDPNHNSAQSGRKNRKHKHGQNHQQQQRRPNRRPSLLEMLLAKEIRHERNVILQCVHHIVKNKFFGIGQGKIIQVIENGAG